MCVRKSYSEVVRESVALQMPGLFLISACYLYLNSISAVVGIEH